MICCKIGMFFGICDLVNKCHSSKWVCLSVLPLKRFIPDDPLIFHSHLQRDASWQAVNVELKDTILVSRLCSFQTKVNGFPHKLHQETNHATTSDIMLMVQKSQTTTVWMYKTLQIMRYLPYQLVQDFCPSAVVSYPPGNQTYVIPPQKRNGIVCLQFGLGRG